MRPEDEGTLTPRPSRRVLVVDDSAFIRGVISRIVAADPSLVVVGTARDGREAVERAIELRPDVITMDVEMPVSSGIEATREIMAARPVPIVMLSSLTRSGAQPTIDALAAGAVDFITKPTGLAAREMATLQDTVLQKIRAALLTRPRAPHPPPVASRISSSPKSSDGSGWTIVVGSSTGGPAALVEVFTRIGPTGARIAVVQHMPEGFTHSLAARLDRCSATRVREATAGEPLQEGTAYIAPGGKHMRITSELRVALDDGAPLHGVRPAADILFESAARWAGPRILGVILTGMGVDGARGMALVKGAGGRTLVEDESTCVVPGMPRAALALGVVDAKAPITGMAAAIRQVICRG